jgi:hypothetical protein
VTVALDLQSALLFKPVCRITARDKRSSVSIKVGKDSVQIIYAELQPIGGILRVPTCDVIFAVDIEEINVSSYVDDENEFVLKGRGVRLIFSSPKRHDIIQAIQNIKASARDRNPMPLAKRGMRAGSLPGALLNASFLYLPHDDQDIRLAAWNLLCTLSKAYHIEPNKQFQPASGIYITPLY